MICNLSAPTLIPHSVPNRPSSGVQTGWIQTERDHTHSRKALHIRNCKSIQLTHVMGKGSDSSDSMLPWPFVGVCLLSVDQNATPAAVIPRLDSSQIKSHSLIRVHSPSSSTRLHALPESSKNLSGVLPGPLEDGLWDQVMVTCASSGPESALTPDFPPKLFGNAFPAPFRRVHGDTQ